MKIQVNTDNVIQGRQDVIALVESAVNSKLGAVSEAITRVEVHLQDQNAQKSGPDDKRCQVEARLQGRAPVSASHASDNIASAVSGAIDKLRNVLDTELGKMRQHR